MKTGNVDPGASSKPRLWFACAVLGLAAPATAWSQVPGEKTVEGLLFRIGIASAEQIMALPSGRPERVMHAHPARDGTDHVVIVLIDARTGARIDRARVTAAVSRMGMDYVRRPLERMDMGGATSWGGYFDLRAPGPYLIRVEAATAGYAAPVVAEFTYRNR